MEFMSKLIIVLIIINLNVYLISCCYLNCKCLRNSITCKNLNLKEIPHDIPVSVTSLDLSFNNINNIPNNSFIKLKNLKFLRLSNNEIKTIDENAFVGLESLKDLHLEHNDLKYLHPEMFNKGLNRLLHVYLTSNEFDTIPVLKATQITKLNLDSNKITTAFINESFLLNTNLQTLDLTGNSINKINDSDFMNLRNTQLITLKIKLNKLQNITSEAFSPIKNTLKTLELEGNKLLNSNIIKRALKGLNKAYGMQYLDLKMCGLTDISEDFLQPFYDTKLHQLDLSHNPLLVTIAESAFDGLKKVQYLHLENCKISSSNIRFSSMEELRELYLNDNNLISCPLRVPASLIKLELQSNDIRSIEKNNFKSLTNLVEINLQKNSILSIELDSFADLTKLERLNLGFNRISTIDQKIFFPMPSLKVLNLEGQKPCLKSINPRSFVLSSLESLELQENCLVFKETESNFFANLPNLVNLSLRANQLEILNERIFAGSGNIQLIDLSMNKISIWTPRTFLPFTLSVREINLKSNKLSFISHKSTSNNYLPSDFQSLQRIYLENNVWNCTCGNVFWLLHFTDRIPNNDKIICRYPQEKYGTKLLTIMKNCSESNHNPFKINNKIKPGQWKENMLIVLVVLIGALIGICLCRYRFKVHRCFLRIAKLKYSYRHLSDSINNDNNPNFYSNPIQDELIENNESDGVDGSLQFHDDNSRDPQTYGNQSSEDSLPENFNADFVILSENDEFNIQHDKINIRFYSDLSQRADWNIVSFCERLVIDSLFSNFDTINKIFQIRKNKTFICYESDDSQVNFQNKYPENKTLDFVKYEQKDFASLYYAILDR